MVSCEIVEKRAGILTIGGCCAKLAAGTHGRLQACAHMEGLIREGITSKWRVEILMCTDGDWGCRERAHQKRDAISRGRGRLKREISKIVQRRERAIWMSV